MKEYTGHTSLGDVAIRESDGGGRSVLLIHGNSLGAESFMPQLSGEPGARLRLISFDFPGHGGSPRAANPVATYSASGYCRIIREVVSLLGIQRPVVVGHSLGGHMALQAIAAGFAVSGLMVLGTPPLGGNADFATAFQQGAGELAFRGHLSDSDIERMAGAFMPEGVQPPPYYARSIRATDPAARELLGISISAHGVADEKAALMTLRCPAAMVLGERERVVNLDYVRGLSISNLWRGGPQIVRGAGHCPQYDNEADFNRLLAEFLADVP